MKKLTRSLTIAVLLTILSLQAFGSTLSFTGSLTAENGGLVGTGAWVDALLLPAHQRADWFAPTLEWTVTKNANLTWHYDYTLRVYVKEVSHFTVEASESFRSSNIWNAAGPFGKIEVQDFQPGGASNPGMPSTVHCIKFDDAFGTTVRVTFDSDRVPVWGDIFAKSGTSGGDWNAIWNAGFTTPDFDPTVPASNGSYQNHVLVPDTMTNVPEPTSLVSLLAGVMGLIGLRGRRRE